MGQSFQGKLRVRHAQYRAVLPDIELYRVVFIGNIAAREQPRRIAEIKLLRLPGQQSGLNLLGEAIGLGGSAESLFGQNPGGFMIAVAVPLGAAETAGQNIRAESPDGQYQ